MEHTATTAVGGVLSDGHVHATVVEGRCGDQLAGPDVFAVVLVRALGVTFVAVVEGNGFAVTVSVFRRIAVVRPNQLQGNRLFCDSGDSLEGVAHTVAAAKEDQRFLPHFPQRRRRPLSMKESPANARVLPGDQPPRVLVEGDQCRGLGTDDEGVHGDPVAALRTADTVGGSHVKNVAMEQYGAAGGIVGTNIEFVDRIETPKDVGVLVG